MAKPNNKNTKNNNREKETEFTTAIVSVNRVSTVVKGGRTFSFSAIVVVGDGSGRVGFGVGKAKEVQDAVSKATKKAMGSLIRVPLRDGARLHHDVEGQFGASKVILRYAPSGTGIIAGGAMRSVFEGLGVQDVVAKSIGSTNPYNLLRATFDALQNISSPRAIAGKRGKRIGELISRRESDSGDKAANSDDEKAVKEGANE